MHSLLAPRLVLTSACARPAQAANSVKTAMEADGIKLVALVNNAGVQRDMPVELQVRACVTDVHLITLIQFLLLLLLHKPISYISSSSVRKARR